MLITTALHANNELLSQHHTLCLINLATYFPLLAKAEDAEDKLYKSVIQW